MPFLVRSRQQDPDCRRELSAQGENTECQTGLPWPDGQGTPTVPEVLEVLLGAVNFEAMELMVPEGGETPPVFEEFRQLLPDVPLKTLGRYEFYDACCDAAVELAISTGEKRPFANILLTVGCA